MNTISLVLNGRTAADIALLPEKERASISSLPTRRALPRAFSELSIPKISPPASPTLSSSAPGSGWSTPRPSSSRSSSRRSSKDSPGWYNQENSLTLDDFARRLNTRSKKLEIWQGKCAQNVVMSLLRPTPLILFAFNPICMILWVVLGFLWLRSEG